MIPVERGREGGTLSNISLAFPDGGIFGSNQDEGDFKLDLSNAT